MHQYCPLCVVSFPTVIRWFDIKAWHQAQRASHAEYLRVQSWRPILFLALVNDAALTSTYRWKYVDDLSLVEVLPKTQQSSLQEYVDELGEWCAINDVTPKPEKCKAMQVSFLKNPLPQLDITIADVHLERVDSLTLLGVAIQSDLKWDNQVQQMISRAARRLYILSVLKKSGVNANDLVTIYKAYIRPLMEFGVPVWGSGITNTQSDKIERIQRRALRFIVYPADLSYKQRLTRFNLPMLCERRNDLLLRFGRGLLKSERHRDMLPATRQCVSHRSSTLRSAHLLDLQRCKTQRYRNSAIPFLTRMLNSSM